MTTEQLRKFLATHGVAGAPTVPGWYCCAGRNGLGIFLRSDHGVMAGSFVGGDGGDNLRSAGSYFDSDIIRHASLPDFSASAAPQVERCARAPGEGTWSVFAAKVVEERDAALRRVATLEQELAESRAKVASLGGVAREDSGSAFRVGQVWESPTHLTYRVVGIQPPERFHPVQISMRQGADGAGRLFVKRGESTFGWRLVTP